MFSIPCYSGTEGAKMISYFKLNLFKVIEIHHFSKSWNKTGRGIALVHEDRAVYLKHPHLTKPILYYTSEIRVMVLLKHARLFCWGGVSTIFSSRGLISSDHHFINMREQAAQRVCKMWQVLCIVIKGCSSGDKKQHVLHIILGQSVKHTNTSSKAVPLQMIKGSISPIQ